MKKRLLILLFCLFSINVGFFLVSLYLVHHTEETYPPIGTLVNVNGIQIHLSDSGEITTPPQQRATESPTTPTLVFLHGSGANLRDFEAIQNLGIGKDYRIVSIDRPGHGYSERGASQLLSLSSELSHQQADWINPAAQANLIASALETIGVERSVWVGHSWAASVVLAALVSNDPRIEAGVLLNGLTHPVEKERALYERVAQQPFIGDIFRWQYIAPIGYLAIDTTIYNAFKPEVPPADYAEQAGLYLALRPDSFKYQQEDSFKLPNYLQHQLQYYPDVKQPLLSITSDSDTIVPTEDHHRKLASQITHMQSLVLRKAGHVPHHTRPREVFEAIDRFIRSVEEN